MKRFLRNALKCGAGFVAILAILLILFYAEEDWRGARDWAACQKEIAVKGETLDLRQLAPPGKPEDDLSKVPLFTKNYQKNLSHYLGLLMKIPPPRQLSHLNVYLGNENSYKRPLLSNFIKGQPTDLAVWQKFYRSLPEAHLTEQIGAPAQDVLQTLSQFDPVLNEIETKVRNPKAFWSINYEEPFITPIEGPYSMGNLAQVLFLKAVAHLENQDAESAKEDYLFSLKLGTPLERGCFLSSYMTIQTTHYWSNAILWEGIHRHGWTDAQLREMESTMAATDMLLLAANSFRFDRACALQTISLLQAPSAEFLEGQKIKPDYNVTFIFRLSLIRPKGWWDQDRRRESIEIQERIDAIDCGQGLVDSKAFDRETYASETAYYGRLIYTPMSVFGVRSVDSFGTIIAKTETYRRLARLACRLEEYRIAKGQYPEKLEELPDLPAHLNQEVLSEQPLRYSRQGDGYKLYSVGWDQKDDGGVIGKDSKEGDWVWPSP